MNSTYFLMCVCVVRMWQQVQEAVIRHLQGQKSSEHVSELEKKNKVPTSVGRSSETAKAHRG
eukprot:TRINITY_DN15051_c0_g1_i1.p2 TRINITY_DN15051_c0_g1~~TRINITY_DN15051_c0_g1_i1.p2  ORF type:complete len:62 (+),score=8.25 TRINITY_DN15051_c0_g1_i1:240-425(+)